MKICGISDIHGNLKNNIPECDVLCICGDIINLNDQRDMPASKKWWETRFIEWVEKLPCKKVIVVPGNHDFYLETLYKFDQWSWFKDRMRLLSNFKIECLIDESYEYEGIHFYGTPWIQPINFQEGRWAFEHPEGDEHYAKIPKCDVLITHDNPYKNNKLSHYCWNKCDYHLFGHWHDGEDDSIKGKFNCSILDDWYNHKKKFKCVIIDIMTRKEVVTEVMEYFMKDVLFTCPKDNNIQEHNKKIFDLFTKYLEEQEDGPVLEDTIPWEHPMENHDASIITDFND